MSRTMLDLEADVAKYRQGRIWFTVQVTHLATINVLVDALYVKCLFKFELIDTIVTFSLCLPTLVHLETLSPWQTRCIEYPST